MLVCAASPCVLFVAALDLRGKLCCGVVAFRCAHGGKASKMMICGVSLPQGPGPKSSQVQCAVGDSAKPRQSVLFAAMPLKFEVVLERLLAKSSVYVGNGWF